MAKSKPRAPPSRPSRGDSNQERHPTSQSYQRHPPPTLPQRPPASMYEFGSGRRPPQDFSYRPSFDGPDIEFQNSDHYSPKPSQRARPRPWRGDDAPPRGRQQPNRDSYRPYQNRPRLPNTHERPLLQARRETTPEQLPGMTDDQSGTRKFISADDVSDSDEADMEVDSSSNHDAASSPRPGIETVQEADFAEGPPRKRQALERPPASDDDRAKQPKWSNPDLYSAIPADDLKKTKDVVKLIRKARVAAEKVSPLSQNAVAANDDFIGFDFDDQPDGLPSDRQDPAIDGHADRGNDLAAGISIGPKDSQSSAPFSHRAHLRGEMSSSKGISLDQMPTARNGSSDSSFANLGSQQSPIYLDSHEWPPPTVAAAVVDHGGHSNLPRPPIRGEHLTHGNRNPDDIADKNLRSEDDPNLGSRKRTFDDHIKATLPHKKYLAKLEVVPLWEPRRGTDPTPWCVVDHYKTTNMGLWLHKEICDFYDYVKPRHFEDSMRSEMLQGIRSALSQNPRHRDATLFCFGSYAAGLYLPTSDMDLVLNSAQFLKTGYSSFTGQGGTIKAGELHKLGAFIAREGLAEAGSMQVVAKARVPIIKWKDRLTGLNVDLSFDSDTGTKAIETFSSWKSQYPAMPILVTLIKHFLAMRGQNEVSSGGLGGFSVTCLVTSLLQMMPEIQSGNMKPEDHLGDILMEFFLLYGKKFNTRTTGIQLDPPGYFEKRRNPTNIPYRPANMSRLSIIDPNRPSNDVSGGTGNIKLIFDMFSRAYDTLQTGMSTMECRADRRGQSLLGPILAGNYRNFDDQRERLYKLYHRD